MSVDPCSIKERRKQRKRERGCALFSSLSMYILIGIDLLFVCDVSSASLLVCCSSVKSGRKHISTLMVRINNVRHLYIQFAYIYKTRITSNNTLLFLYLSSYSFLQLIRLLQLIPLTFIRSGTLINIPFLFTFSYSPNVHCFNYRKRLMCVSTVYILHLVVDGIYCVNTPPYQRVS